ncbi:phage tail sheath family protein [Aureibacter tunicatorum]|uniref:Tail sheath protein C-terminal domain-containing protein n=1 Tax=Aureibacter tunicatorum TaxID=866807 RepID=A0AAE4BR04_9BACT|nr:phage tail sheath C-terminal domain-containing protein [Aureibacter tunicatorum]MDR6237433.1 hypothetical protein [Aureibacter tunicatorum]BDD06423.1 hypothetical protein AUTU_39060 [Aureibacter tunicatorum]
MAQNLATPGVYVEEKAAFSNSVVGIPTAIPAFIGYTEKSMRNGQTLVNEPIKVSSLREYTEIFGGGPLNTFEVVESTNADGSFDFEVDSSKFILNMSTTQRFLMYDSLRMFFSNGGKDCYIVSVGAFYKTTTKEVQEGGKPANNAGGKDAKDAKAGGQPQKKTVEVKVPAQIKKKELEQGINSLIGEEEPTLLVVPEAVMLEEAECYAVQQAMLMHCGGKEKNRFSILDVHNGFLKRTEDANDVVTKFRAGIGTNFLNFGAAYYPWVAGTVVESDEIGFDNIKDLQQLKEILNKEAAFLGAGNQRKISEIQAEVAKIGAEGTDEEQLVQTLTTNSPAFKNLVKKIKDKLNLLPPSAGMAGIYASVDSNVGVWQAPANVSFSSIVGPSVKLTNDDQEDLNVTVSGKSVNALRAFIGEGTIVWGARTLDGNSNDWRYINVRRTLLYIEQSIKYASKSYVYSPNTSNTWVLVKSMINSFLNDLWKAGGLVGANPNDAYQVEVGLGSTMTPNDILEGIMKVTVKVAISRPAEFIVLTFQQKLQES